MDTFLQITVSGLTVGAMYAVGTLALSLLWGSMGMLNMAHGAFIAIGGYTGYWVMTVLGGHWLFVLPIAALAGMLAGYALYHLVVRWMYEREGFSVNIIIVTVAIASLVENGILNIAGPSAMRQPFRIPSGFKVSDVVVPYQTLLTLALAIAMMVLVSWLVNKTKVGYVIRAVSQNKDAALLMGINVQLAFTQALVLAGGIAAVSGVMVTSMTQLYPAVGYDTTVKSFIICIIAGLGNIPGALTMAFVLGMFEITVQYVFGQRYGFPAMLGLVVLVLIWRPNGVFGKATVNRV